MLPLYWKDHYGEHRRFNASKILVNQRWVYPEHRHEDWVELNYIVSGEMQQHACGDACPARPGQMYIFREGSYHHLETQACLFYNVNFPLAEFEQLVEFLRLCESVSHVFAPAGGYRCVEIPASQQKALVQLCDTLVRSSQGASRDRLFQRTLIDWIDGILAPAEASTGEVAVPPAIREVTERIERHFSPEMRVADMVRISGWSPSKLSQQFKKYLGMTPSTFLNGERLRHAAQLLINTNLDMATLSLEAGFDNLSYFHRLFKEAHGCTPRTYRSLHSPLEVPLGSAGE